LHDFVVLSFALTSRLDAKELYGPASRSGLADPD